VASDGGDAGTTAFAYDERCLAHDNGSMVLDERAAAWIDVPHFERPERLSRTMDVLAQAGVLDRLQRLESRASTRDELELVHTARLIDEIEAACARGEHLWVGPQGRVGPDSWEPALLAAGGVVAATEAVLDGAAAQAFALVRPPGHHSSADTAMGFCLFNNVAIAARRAQRRPEIERVAIVDWDVHHGNGTQAVFYDDPSVLFCSLHQDDLYPKNDGRLDQRGGPGAGGANLNVPLPPGSGDAGYALAFERVVAPALRGFAPDLLLISAGQDPAACDPLGRMSVTTEGFRAVTVAAKDLAAELCGGRIAVALEGGYSLQHAPFCNLAIVEALGGFDPALAADPLELDVPAGLQADERAAVERAAAVHGFA
jgi:acetoin utilization deacetylase AcuC-like enzyme